MRLLHLIKREFKMTNDKESRRPRVGTGRARVGYRDDNSANENERKTAYSTRESFQREPRTSGDDRRNESFNRERSDYGNRNSRPNNPFDRDSRQSSYGQQRPQEGYGNRPQGGYGNRYDQDRPQRDNYDNRPSYDREDRGGRSYDQGGYGNQRPSYGNNRQQGGYGNRQQGGGYDNRQQGGYGCHQQSGDRRPYGNEDRPSYGDRQQGGSNRPFRPRTEDYNPNAKYSLQKQLKYKEDVKDPNEPIRLNKFLANSGICSRREADEFIQAGVVTVNGEVVKELGRKVLRSDKVMFHNEIVSIESKLYVLLNKPKNCVTTSDDPQGRLTVLDLVRNACSERIYPIGRLDRNTTGILLLTNDGDLASKLSHPKYNKKKIYQVWLDRDVTLEDMQKIADGVELEDGEIHADAISYVSEEDKSQIGIEIHSGRNRVVRRIFEKLGYRVMKLDRVYFAGLTKKNLPRGRWRYLDEKEVAMLRMGSYE